MASRPVFDFGPFRLNPSERLLTKDGQSVALPRRAFDTLVILVQSKGRLLTKSELMTAVWPDCFVEEANLMVAVSTVRKALGDEEPQRKYIQTVPGTGYRFIGDIVEAAMPEPSQPDPVQAVAVPVQPVRAFHWSRWIAGVAVLVLAVVAGAWALKSRLMPAVHPIRTVAVLPFRTLGEDTSQEYLGLGMTDALITKLGVVGGITVRPTGAVIKYAKGTMNPLAAGREQSVDAILDGRIQASPSIVRVTVQLVRVSDGVTVWAGAFEQSPQQMFRLQDSMGETIAGQLAQHLTGQQLTGEEKRRIAKNDTLSNEAYESYMRGRLLWNRRTEDSLVRGIDYFQKAIDADPNYALAYAGLADSYALMASFSVEPGRKAHPNARAAALRAIQLDSSLAEPHASLGMISFFSDWEFKEAERHFREAISLHPEYATAHHWYALDLAAMGRLPESLSEVRRAEQLDPNSMIIDTNVGWILYFSRRYDEAIVQYRRTLDLDPGFARARTRLGIALALEGDFPAAIPQLEDAVRLSGSDPYVEGVLAYARALSGDKAAARKTLRGLNERSKNHYVPPFSNALVCIGLGDKAEALRWLEQAYEDHSTSMVYAKVDPILDPLRAEPRFQALLTRMGL